MLTTNMAAGCSRWNRYWAIGLAVCLAGCGPKARVELLQGELGDPNARITVVTVVAGADEHTRQGVLHLQFEEWALAAEAFEAALDSNPKMTEAKFGLGVSREMLGDMAEAARLYKAAYYESDGRQDKYKQAYDRVKGQLEESGS